MRPALALIALPALLGAQDPPLLQVPRMFPSLGEARAVALGDLDGDLDLDAVVLTLEGAHVLTNDKGSFEPLGGALLPIHSSTGDEEEDRVFLVDVDGDTDLDVFTFRNFHIGLFLNQGDATFADVSDSIPTLPGIKDADVGDLDGDGDLDALVVTSQQQSRLYRNDGAGGFALEFVNQPTYASAVRLADVDGDGDLDAFAGSALFCDPFLGCDAGHPSLAINDGTGSFTAVSMPHFDLDARRIAVGDLDRDGFVDALYDDGTLALGDGTGTFTAVPTGMGTGNAIRDLHLFDMDEDGDLDVYVSARADESIFDEADIYGDRLYENKGSLVFEDVSDRLGPACCSSGAVATGTLDDGPSVDLLVGDAPRPLFADMDGAFRDGNPLGFLADVPVRALALGDLDADGDLDALHAAFDRIHVLLNDGEGSLLLADASTPYPLEARELIAADIDGDGDVDPYVVLTNSPDRLYRNEGGMLVEVTSTQLPFAMSPSRAGLFADVDDDGDPDLIVVGLSLTNSYLFLNDGTGTFVQAPASDFPDENVGTALVAFDANGDGHLDVGVADGDLFLADGTGAWSLVPWGIPDLLTLAPGDLDGDGDLDLVGRDSSQSYLYWNDGSATFTPGASLVGSGDFALADLDRDGDLDVYLASGDWNVNDGTGAFTAATYAEFTGFVGGPILEFGDLDGDSDLDLIAPGQWVLINAERQTSWRTLAALGRRLELEIHGEAGSIYGLFWALGAASVPLPPYGTLQLDPLSLRFLIAAVVPPAGKATVSLPLPSDPALAGLDVVWQSIVGTVPLFTNRETTPVLSLGGEP